MSRKSYVELNCQGQFKRLKSLIKTEDFLTNDENIDLVEGQCLYDNELQKMTVVPSEKDPLFPSYSSHEIPNLPPVESPFDAFLEDPRLDSYDDDDDWYFKAIEIDHLKDKLRDWKHSFSISTIALTNLLCILKSHEWLSDLPSNGSSLLGTPAYVPVEPGYYFHLGLEKNLKTIWTKTKILYSCRKQSSLLRKMVFDDIGEEYSLT